MPDTEKPVIQTIDLVKNYSLGDSTIKVLKGINIDIFSGEFVILFGPSGSGKTTLLNMIAGLDHATSGSVIVNDINLGKSRSRVMAKHRLLNVGIVFQDFNLIPTMTALQNVTLPLIFNNMGYKQRIKIAKELLVGMGLEKRFQHKPIELSGGEQQRVAIARSLVNNPPILIIDEPTGNLDSKAANDIMKIIKSLNKESKKTILLVTHNPNYLGLANRVIEMQDGKVTGEMKGDS